MNERLTRKDIDDVKKEYIARNTLLTPIDVAALLSYSVRKVFNLVEEGKLEEANDTPGCKGTRISLWSVDQYRRQCVKKALKHRAG